MLTSKENHSSGWEWDDDLMYWWWIGAASSCLSWRWVGQRKKKVNATDDVAKKGNYYCC